jgi:hypothetical protein
MVEPRHSHTLRHVRAAQLRGRVTRAGIIKVILGMLFLAGALGHARAADHHDRQSLLWMTLLLVMSTANVALGIRGLARARRRSPRWWVAAALAWGLLATILVGFLLRG